MFGAAIAYVIVGLWDACGYIQTARDMQNRGMIARGRQMALALTVGVLLYLFVWPCPQLVSRAIYWLADQLDALRQRWE